MKIFERMERNPQLPIAITAERNILGEEVLSLSQSLGTSLGHRLVFLLCRNTPGSYVSYFSLLHAGVVPLLLEASLAPELLQNLADVYHPQAIFAPRDSDRIPFLAEYVRMAKKTEIPHEYAFWRSEEETPFLHPALRLLLSTSGSTGSPKLVRLTAKNLDENASSIVTYLKIDEKERPITMLPMSYSYGMSILHSHLMQGAAVILTETSIVEEDFWRLVRTQGVTSLAGVPATYRMLDQLKIQEMELPSVHTLTQAGGKLSEKLHRKFAQWCENTGRRFYVMYGQTEAAPRMGYLPAEKALEKCGSMGIAIPGGELFLRDSDGRKIEEPNIVGEFVYRGPNVAMGYAEKPSDLQKGDEWHGILYTGDMAKQDEDGFFTIVGRKKRFIKILGKRVNLDEVEREVSTWISGSVACAGEDERLEIYIESGETDSSAIRQEVSRRMSIPMNAIHVHLIDHIPRNASGKILYKELHY